MEFSLPPRQRHLVGSVRELAKDEFKRDALKYLDGSFPSENIRKLAAPGVLGIAVAHDGILAREGMTGRLRCC